MKIQKFQRNILVSFSLPLEMPRLWGGLRGQCLVDCLVVFVYIVFLEGWLGVLNEIGGHTQLN
jgi:hypothetical protein